MLNPDHVGRRSERREILLEPGQLKLFAKAIQETNPIYFDELAAKSAGHRALLAPPTFGSCLRLLAPSKELSYESLGIDYKRLLHAQEAYEYFHPIYAGDQLALIAEVTDIYEKKGGALQFMVIVTSIFRDQDLVQKITGTLVMRETAPAEQKEAV